MDNVSLGRYRVIRQLGSGGMGEVYLAEDMRLKRSVALKRLTGPAIGSLARSLGATYLIDGAVQQWVTGCRSRSNSSAG